MTPDPTIPELIAATDAAWGAHGTHWLPRLADLLHRRPDLADVALAPLDLGRWCA